MVSRLLSSLSPKCPGGFPLPSLLASSVSHPEVLFPQVRSFVLSLCPTWIYFILYFGFWSIRLSRVSLAQSFPNFSHVHCGFPCFWGFFLSDSGISSWKGQIRLLFVIFLWKFVCSFFLLHSVSRGDVTCQMLKFPELGTVHCNMQLELCWYIT